MSYLWIALVVMVALSPLLSMMPSRRQRQIADLRQRAAVLGMQVQLLEPPDGGVNGAQCAYYGRHRQRGDRKAQATVLYRHEGETWLTERGAAPRAGATLFGRLPEGVSHIRIDFQGAGMFWDESGQESDVETINEVLMRLLQVGEPKEN